MSVRKSRNQGKKAYVPNGHKPLTHALHFRNHGARRRALANFEKQNASGNPGPVAFGNGIAYANPKDIVKVPVRKGFDNDFATWMRAQVRREKRREAEKSFLQRAK